MSVRFKKLLNLYLEEKACHHEYVEFLEMVATGLYDQEISRSMDRDIQLEMENSKVVPKVGSKTIFPKILKKVNRSFQKKKMMMYSQINSPEAFLKTR